MSHFSFPETLDYFSTIKHGLNSPHLGDIGSFGIRQAWVTLHPPLQCHWITLHQSSMGYTTPPPQCHWITLHQPSMGYTTPPPQCHWITLHQPSMGYITPPPRPGDTGSLCTKLLLNLSGLSYFYGGKFEKCSRDDGLLIN